MEIHHAMAVTYAHFVPGFLEKITMSKEEMDEYDELQKGKMGTSKFHKECAKLAATTGGTSRRENTTLL